MSLNRLVIGWVVGGYLFASLLGIAKGSRPATFPRVFWRLGITVPYALLSGLGGAVVAEPVLHAMNGHFWSIAPTVRDLLLPPRSLPAGTAVRVPIDDEAFGPGRLSATLRVPPNARDLVVLVHGLGGSRTAGYVLRAARERHPEVAAGSGRHQGQRGAPGAPADNSQLHAFTPAPLTVSASGSSGQRGRATTSSGSVKPCAKRSAPAQPIIAALSVQSQSGGAKNGRPFDAARLSSA